MTEQPFSQTAVMRVEAYRTPNALFASQRRAAGELSAYTAAKNALEQCSARVPQPQAGRIYIDQFTIRHLLVLPHLVSDLSGEVSPYEFIKSG